MVHEVKKAESKQLSTITKAWNPTNESFTVDQVIDAYLTGLNKGISDLDAYIKRQLTTNCDQVQNVGSAFLNEINATNTVCKSAFLKIESINSFKIIYALQKDIYTDDELARPIYERSWEISRKFDEKDIILSISFMPHTGNINLYRLSADGYHLSYGKLQQS